MVQIKELEKILKGQLDWHGARINFLALFIIALIRVKTVNLVEIATGFIGDAQVTSHYKRLQRFFRSFEIDFSLIAQLVVRLLPIREEAWVLTLDRTNWKYGKSNINILTLGIAYKGIAFPLLWMLLNKRGNSDTAERIELIERFIALFGVEKIKCLTADREFIGYEWFRYLKRRRVSFRIRIKNNTVVPNSQGQRIHIKKFFRSLKIGQSAVLSGRKDVWGHKLYLIGLMLKDADYLIIATDKEPCTALEEYGKRWEIETLFGCLKSRGFCFESTHITDPDRISKLMALLSTAFCWAHLIGEWLHEEKQIPLKKHNRKAKSLFRYGFDYLRNIILNMSEKVEELSVVFQFLAST